MITSDEQALIEAGGIKSFCDQPSKIKCKGCGDTTQSAEDWARNSGVCQECEGSAQIVICARCEGVLDAPPLGEHPCHSLDLYRRTKLVVFAEEMLAAKEQAAASERARAVEEQLEAERRNVEEQARIRRERTERVDRENRERAAAERAERERLERERSVVDRSERARLDLERSELERGDRGRRDIERTESERPKRARFLWVLFTGVLISSVLFAIQWLYFHVPTWLDKEKEVAKTSIPIENKSAPQTLPLLIENSKDSRQIVTTPFGKVSISSNHRILLNDQEIKPIISGDFGLILDTQIPFGEKYAILITTLSGGTACPAKYRWLILAQSQYVVSEEFGTCSDKAKPSVRGGALTVTMPGNGGDEVQYSFDGRVLTEVHSVQVTEKARSSANPGLSSEFSKCINDAGGITMEVMECQNAETEVQAQRMNRALDQLKNNFAGTERSYLERSQLAWESKATSDCMSSTDVGGTTKIVGTADCMLGQLSSRAKYLESILSNQDQKRPVDPPMSTAPAINRNLQIELFRIVPDLVEPGDTFSMEAIYTLESDQNTDQRVEITEIRGVQFFDPRGGVWRNLGAEKIPVAIRMKPGSNRNRTTGQTRLPTNMQEGRYRVIFAVSALGEEKQVSREIIVKKSRP